jgi:biopolymer transport protein ExbD
MGRAKIPRKSTNIDMTAMCDVAFLLLSFFILATKQKPPEAVSVAPPKSVSSEVAKDKAVLTTLDKNGKVFLMIGDDAKKVAIIKDVNRQLGLTDQEVMQLSKMPFIAMPLSKLKPMLNLSNPLPPDQMEGIPIKDTLNNELVYWLNSVKNVYATTEMTPAQLAEILLIKGDGDALYPDFQNVKYAYKKNDLLKFRLVTNSKAAPDGTELYKERKSGKKLEL